MPLKKPSEIFYSEPKSSLVIEDSAVLDNSSDIKKLSETLSDTFDKFKSNINKIEDISYDQRFGELSSKIEIISEELSTKLTNTDLENAMLSHLMILDENFKQIQNQVRGINKEDLREFKLGVSELTDFVENLVDIELPKYKKKIIDSEFKITNRFDQFSDTVEKNLDEFEISVEEKINNVSDFVDEKLLNFNNLITETKNEVSNTRETYQKLYKIVENKSLKENEKLEEYNQVLNEFNNRIENFEQEVSKIFDEYKILYSENLNEKFEFLSLKIQNEIDVRENNYKQLKNSLTSEVSSIKDEISSTKAEIIINEKHIKNVSHNLEIVENYIQDHHKDVVNLREEIFSEIEKLPSGDIIQNIRKIENKISYIEEVYSKIEPETIIKEVLTAEPPKTDNKDPLTPLDQNFVTLDQLQQHYRLFINRIQQQLSSLGGGGETQLKYLDDIVGIATNASAYDGKYLKYNHLLRKFEFTDVDISNDSWSDGINGPYTYGSVGIGTSIARFPLEIGAVGASGTSLFINGDVRIIGILSIGSGTITLDPSENTVSIGTAITLDSATGTISIGTDGTTLSMNQSGDAFYSGIITAANLNVLGDVNFNGSLYQNESPFVASRWTAGTGDNIYRLNGNVGLGTTNPTSKLYVNGDTFVTGVVTASSNVDVFGDLYVKGNITVGVVTANTFYGKSRENIITVNTNYSVQTTDSVILATGNIGITMPSAIGLSGDKYYIKNVGVGTVTIRPSGTELIDDYTEILLESKNTALTLISNNSKWLIF